MRVVGIGTKVVGIRMRVETLSSEESGFRGNPHAELVEACKHQLPKEFEE